MAANVIRADYAQLTRTATMFGQHAEQARAVLQRLRQDLENLQAGDWLGQGAQAFYAEMNGQVLPTLNRLVQALEQAADTVRQINQIAQQAEREAAACLRGEGGATGAGAAIGSAAADLGLDSGGASASPVG